jgi:cob(I)alamin adenosyltransferase
MATNIYTKTGDTGDTGLSGGARVPKDHVRVEAYGTVDELNASIGQARSLAPPTELDAVLERVQHRLFDLGAELAKPPSRANQSGSIDETDVAALERAIDEQQAALPPLTAFVLPAGCPLAASLHCARTVCRRAERRVVTLRRTEPQTSKNLLVFLNRLSDLLFVLARRTNQLAGLGDAVWQSNSSKST